MPDEGSLADIHGVGYAVATPPAGPNCRGWNGLHWDGEEVAILASGPSLSETQAEIVRGWRERGPRRVIAINTTYQRAPWADAIYACDPQWWDIYAADVRKRSDASLWTQDAAAATKYDLNLIRSARGKGLSRAVGVVNQGYNSGYQAIGLAYWAGVSHAYLLGYDMKGCHWHGPHPAKLHKQNRFDIFLENFRQLANDIETEKGFAVVNCTPDSALKSFPTANLTEVFAA